MGVLVGWRKADAGGVATAMGWSDLSTYNDTNGCTYFRRAHVG